MAQNAITKINPTGARCFDYGALAPEVAECLRKQTDRIRTRTKATCLAIIEIGRDLVAVRQSIGHGLFVKWVEAECGFTPRSAQKYMRAAEFAEGKSELSSFLSPTTLYKLSAKSTPPEVIQAVLSRAASGVISDADINRMCRTSASPKPKGAAPALAEEDKRKAERRREREAAAKTAARHIVKYYGPVVAKLLMGLKGFYRIIPHLQHEIDAQAETPIADQ